MQGRKELLYVSFNSPLLPPLLVPLMWVLEGWAALSLCVRREVQGGDSSQSPHPWRCLRMWHCALGWVTRWGSPTAWALIVLWFLHSFITHSLVISGVFSSLIVLSFLYSFITHSLGSNCSVIPSFLHHLQLGHIRALICDSFIPSSLYSLVISGL